MWMLGGIFSLVGAPMVWLALRAFARDRVIATWPRAPGVVTASRVESWMQPYKDKNGLSGTYKMYGPIVQYRYEVAGQTLEGSGIRREGHGTDEEGAQRQADRYPLNGQVMVFHDPSDPKTAFLETQTNIGAVILSIFGGMWIAVGVLLIGLSFL